MPFSEAIKEKDGFFERIFIELIPNLVFYWKTFSPYLSNNSNSNFISNFKKPKSLYLAAFITKSFFLTCSAWHILTEINCLFKKRLEEKN